MLCIFLPGFAELTRRDSTISPYSEYIHVFTQGTGLSQKATTNLDNHNLVLQIQGGKCKAFPSYLQCSAGAMPSTAHLFENLT